MPGLALPRAGLARSAYDSFGQAEVVGRIHVVAQCEKNIACGGVNFGQIPRGAATIALMAYVTFQEISYYTTELDLPARLPTSAVRTTLYSADRDLTPASLREIEELYRPAAVDQNAENDRQTGSHG